MTVRRSMAAAFLLSAAALPGQAQEWSYKVTPYIWGSGVSGTLGVGPGSIDFDQSFSDVLDSLDGGFFINGEAVRDRFVMMGDYTITRLSQDVVIPPGVAGRARVDQQSLTLLGGYRVAEISADGANVDLFGGMRAWWVDTRLRGGGLSRERERSFADPIIAMRVQAPIAERMTGMIYADYGGFGIGSDSTAQITAAATYFISEGFAVSVGYRSLWVNGAGDGPLSLDVNYSGPLLGVSWVF